MKLIAKKNPPEGETLTGQLETAGISHEITHVGGGFLVSLDKITYTSPKTGEQVYALQKTGVIEPDGEYCEVWYFADDFLAEETFEDDLA